MAQRAGLLDSIASLGGLPARGVFLNLCNKIWCGWRGGGQEPTHRQIASEAKKENIGLLCSPRTFCYVKQPQKEADFPLKKQPLWQLSQTAPGLTLPLRKKWGKYFHKLERKKPGFQRLLGTQWSFDTTSTFRQTGNWGSGQTDQADTRCRLKPAVEPSSAQGRELPCLSFPEGGFGTSSCRWLRGDSSWPLSP